MSQGHPVRIPLADRFATKWMPEPNSGCHLWLGSVDAKGYGKINPGVRNRSPLRAPRVVWELERGPIPVGLWVLHQCDTPACVNPDHLFLGTPAANTADMMAKGRHVSPRTTSDRCPKGHKTHRRDNGSLRCRTCDRDYMRRRRAAARAAS